MTWSSPLGQLCGSECGLTGTQASACAGSLSVGPEQPVWGTLEEREKRRGGRRIIVYMICVQCRELGQEDR